MYVKQQAWLSSAPTHPLTPTSHRLGCILQNQLESPAGWKMPLSHGILRQGQVLGLGSTSQRSVLFHRCWLLLLPWHSSSKGPSWHLALSHMQYKCEIGTQAQTETPSQDPGQLPYTIQRQGLPF